MAFTAGWWPPMAWPVGLARRVYGVEALPVRWRKTTGPYFVNAVATLRLNDCEAAMTLECTAGTREEPRLQEQHTISSEDFGDAAYRIRAQPL
jgi:hypothetical protein